eukprot:GHVS01032023.1.p1 GENE.GHVS01032023.1~~GHVS01032023.1.p1  ORF type:complete len:178 (+),score=51.61 GHVS01032023.1:136-669(+)
MAIRHLVLSFSAVVLLSCVGCSLAFSLAPSSHGAPLKYSSQTSNSLRAASSPYSSSSSPYATAATTPSHLPNFSSSFSAAIRPHNDNNNNNSSQLNAAVLDDVQAVVIEQLGVDKEKVQPESNFIKDLGADSLDSVELVMALEEKFGVDIPDEEATNIKTVQQAVDYIEKHKKEVAK